MSETVEKVQEAPKKVKKTKKRRGWLVLVAIVIMLVSALSVGALGYNSASVTIVVNSADIAAGTNPDGTPFDIYEVLSDEVLTSASEKLNGRLSAEELKKHLSVVDAFPNNVNQKLKQSILDGEDEDTYFPSAYQLTYSLVPVGEENLPWAIIKNLVMPEKTEAILYAVAESYREYYADTYLKYEGLFDIDWNKIDSMDYYNRAEALIVETSRIQRFLEENYDSDMTIAESVSGLSYGDLSSALSQIISVNIENHRHYIVQNGLTKDLQSLLRQFKYMEDVCLEECERKTELYSVLYDAIDIYEASTTKIVFIPALDQDNSFYMNRTKVGMDYLVEQASAAKLAADEAEHDAQRYAYLQECFLTDQEKTKDMYEHAESVYTQIKEEVSALSETTKQLVEEDYMKANEGIKVSDVYLATSLVSLALSFAKRCAIGGMVVIVFCGLRDLSKKRKAKKKEGNDV